MELRGSTFYPDFHNPCPTNTSYYKSQSVPNPKTRPGLVQIIKIRFTEVDGLEGVRVDISLPLLHMVTTDFLNVLYCIPFISRHTDRLIHRSFDNDQSNNRTGSLLYPNLVRSGEHPSKKMLDCG